MSELYSRSTGDSESDLVPASCPSRLEQACRDLLARAESDRYRAVVLHVYDAEAGPVSERSIAQRAADAVAYVGGYGRTRTLVRTARATREIDRTSMLLAGDYLQGLAYETITDLDAEATTVRRCLDACTRATERLCERWTAWGRASSDADDRSAGAARESEANTPAPAGTIAALAAELGAVLGGASPDRRRTLRDRGRALGPAIVRGDRGAMARLAGSQADVDGQPQHEEANNAR